jgi:hypothetical protein
MAKVTKIEPLMLRGIKITTKGFLVITLLLQQLDLDKMFKETKWEEVESVKDSGYEVEKVTMVAGVRGDEAEHEILKYLYYIVDTKTGQNSLKTGKPIYILVK